jgi:hypothetical protein
MQPRNIALAVASSLALMLAAQPVDADQKIKTKSNIKNDRLASSCTENCVDAGYAWAKANGASDAEDCDASNEEFAAGCRNFVLEGMPAMPAEGAPGAAAPLADGGEATDGDDVAGAADDAADENEAADPPQN